MNEPANSLETALADRYVVERELGAGGMATVYLARGLKFDRFVALKVLRPELAAVLGKERFGVARVPSSHWLDASTTKGDTWDRGKQIPTSS